MMRFFVMLMILSRFCSAHANQLAPLLLDYRTATVKTSSIEAILFPTGEKEIQNIPVQPDAEVCVIGIKETSTNIRSDLLVYAQQYIGQKYGFGSRSSYRIDCSGFTQAVYSKFGFYLPRSASEQSRIGKKISLNELRIGDLLFYRTYKNTPSHVAIYAGDGKILHASYMANRVQFDEMTKSYYKHRFLFAKRVIFPKKQNLKDGAGQ